MAVESTAGTRGTLVVYYSLSGNTARVAKDLATRTHADIESLRDRDHGTGALGYLKAVVDAVRGKPAKLGPLAFSPRSYTLILIGTPVWAGRMTPAIRAYLKNFAADLKNVAFFVTSGGTDVGSIAPAMETVLGHSAVASAGFNATELADPKAYEAKLSAFAQKLNSAPGGQPFDSTSAVHAQQVGGVR